MHLFHQVLVCFFLTFSWLEHGPAVTIKLSYFQWTAYRFFFCPWLFFHCWTLVSTIQWHVTGTQSQLYQPQPNKACCAASKHASDNTLWHVCLVPYWHRVGKLWNSSGQLTEKSSAIACLNPPIACNKSLGCMCQLNHLLERYDTLNVSVMNSWSQKPLKQKR